MIIGFEESDIRRWKSDLIAYEKIKKTGVSQSPQNIENFSHSKPKPQPSMSAFAKQVNVQLKPIVKPPVQRVAKIQESFQKSIRYKYDKPYDIINNYPLVESNLGQGKGSHLRNMAPVRNLYNLINGQKIPDSLLKNRVVILPPFYNKKKVDKPRDFDILNLQQSGINRNQSREQIISKPLVNKKMSQDLVYDKIYNRFYNTQEEEKYWEEKKQKEIERTKQNFENKLPKSYQVRERYIQDFTKPLPEGVIQFTQKTKNLKKHWKLRYIMEEKQKMRGQEQQIKQNNILQVKRDRKISNDHKIFPAIQLNQ